MCVLEQKKIKVPVERFSGLLWNNAFGVTHLVPQANKGRKKTTSQTLHPTDHFKGIKKILLEISVKYLGFMKAAFTDGGKMKGWLDVLVLRISRAEGWNTYTVRVGCGGNPHVTGWFFKIMGKTQDYRTRRFFYLFFPYHFTPKRLQFYHKPHCFGHDLKTKRKMSKLVGEVLAVWQKKLQPINPTFLFNGT